MTPLPSKKYPSAREIVILLLLTAAAIAVHGYHPYVEDAEIYVPGIKKELNPALYTHNSEFFASHANLTLFPDLIAESVRLSHVPFDWALLAWYAFSVFLLLLACWHAGRTMFPDPLAKWGGVALVGALLTIPVAGTALYIMDQYVNTRSLSAPAVIFLLVNMLEGKFVRASVWAAFAAVIHPLMAAFGIACAVLLVLVEQRHRQQELAFAFMALPFFPPVTAAYREILATRSYFFLWEWHWYEWVGIFAPLALLWWFSRIAKTRGMTELYNACVTLVIFGALFFVGALIITVPPSMANYAELQPMRSLHLIYSLLFVVSGGLLAQFVLKRYVWRWAVLFVPLCFGMWFAQRQLFPATPHIEWPDAAPGNNWVAAFRWIRNNTPQDAYFALNPNHMKLPGEDQHGFRAIAERSMLADRVKDSGAVSMFPEMAETWHKQVRAEDAWKSFRPSDFNRLRAEFGVNWVVLEKPTAIALNCPYQNQSLMVCNIGSLRQ